MENRRALRDQLADKYVGHPSEIDESLTVTIARKAFRDGFKAAVAQVIHRLKDIEEAQEAMDRADHSAERDLRDIKLRCLQREFDEFLNENC